jgi:hypothetical protein
LLTFLLLAFVRFSFILFIFLPLTFILVTFILVTFILFIAISTYHARSYSAKPLGFHADLPGGFSGSIPLSVEAPFALPQARDRRWRPSAHSPRERALRLFPKPQRASLR